MRDIVTGLAALAAGVAILVAAAGAPAAAQASNDPYLLPRVIAVGLVICGLAVAGQAVARARLQGTRLGEAEPLVTTVANPAEGWVAPDDPADDAGMEGGPPAGLVTLATAGTILAYGLLAFRVGYLVTTAAFLVALPLVLGWQRDARRLLILAAFAAGLTAAIRLVFLTALNVPLPPTPLP